MNQELIEQLREMYKNFCELLIKAGVDIEEISEPVHNDEEESMEVKLPKEVDLNGYLGEQVASKKLAGGYGSLGNVRISISLGGE